MMRWSWASSPLVELAAEQRPVLQHLWRLLKNSCGEQLETQSGFDKTGSRVVSEHQLLC